MSPDIMREVFPVKKELKYCRTQVFETKNIPTVRCGLETLSHLGPNIWSTIPDELQSLTTVKVLRKVLENENPQNAPVIYVRST